ncbi:uncharacterized protein LOC129769160 [Toxorhynchites rutilus septentrionalis]|uniref:uncharacterized protein LOC129769160 n=1 Tax=Toxorhynchites rutilus septentrionalis TaxID=329112 RepID=UPI0024784487|nr:uncharacterized protein LOC129769160 [Toxorhynchites rutilus septentrionalis]
MLRSAWIVLVVIGVSFECFAISGRVLDRFKARVDERIVRRYRIREWNAQTRLGSTPNQMTQQDTGGVTANNNATADNHIHQEGGPIMDEEHSKMEVSESDLISAGLGQRRFQEANKIFERNVLFRFYQSGNLTKTTTVGENPLLSGTNCSTTEKFSIIAHGWHENCYETFWIGDLEENLRVHRGGCVICMDYSTFSSGGYPYLFKRFNNLSGVLLKFLRSLQYEGMQFENLYMFGFSFGAQLVLDAGNQIGFNVIEEIDTCDMAGPGFDQDRFFKGINFRNAAQNVQCIHTSTDKGTKLMNKCHQDWRMGQCGFKQPAAGKPPLGSHGLCPVFYNLAFSEGFYAEPRPSTCEIVKDRETDYPTGFRMGYMEKRKRKVQGELYAQTTDVYPYTNSFDQLWLND